MGRVTIRMENAYSDGHSSVQRHDVDAPGQGVPIEDWWEDVVWPLTGDGHGIDKDLGSYHLATIIEADRTELIGETFEWDSS
jgi:hypothetical protein